MNAASTAAARRLGRQRQLSLSAQRRCFQRAFHLIGRAKRTGGRRSVFAETRSKAATTLPSNYDRPFTLILGGTTRQVKRLAATQSGLTPPLRRLRLSGWAACPAGASWEGGSPTRTSPCPRDKMLGRQAIRRMLASVRRRSGASFRHAPEASHKFS